MPMSSNEKCWNVLCAGSELGAQGERKEKDIRVQHNRHGIIQQAFAADNRIQICRRARVRKHGKRRNCVCGRNHTAVGKSTWNAERE